MLALALPTGGCSEDARGPSALPDIDPSLCQPTQDSPMSVASTPDPSARVFWDVSKSMRGFAVKNGPLAALNRSLESSALQGVGVSRFSHMLVADAAVEVGSLPQPLKLDGNWTNLPDVAQQAAAALADPASPAISIIISDMLVETPTALREQPRATVCGDVSIPSDESAPFVFGACFERALRSAQTIADAYVGVVRTEAAGGSLFVVVVSRDAEFGVKTQAAISALLPLEATSLVLLDFSQARHPATPGVCRFDPSRSEVLLMDRAAPGSTPACRFRFRRDSAPHLLNCVVTADPLGDAAVTSKLVGVRRGGEALNFDESTGVYRLDSATTTLSIDAGIVPVVEGAFPTKAEARVRAFAGGSAAADTLVGLARALSGLTPPAGPSWHVRYEGRPD
jgi:hypothetical protein